ncbi:uncharacterized protein [Anabrus simplex]|uniref:uncharacterized protein n=1 Tax=Anabrus simplex TaxID=316456 RepID=UPI0035A2AA24
MMSSDYALAVIMASSQVLTDEEWSSAVQKKLGTNDFKILEVSVSGLGEDIGGFLGEHLKVKVTVVTQSKQQQLAFFAKRIPNSNDTSHNELINSSKGFPKETGVFSRLFSLYPECNQPWGPRCYFVRPDVIVLEDLMEQKFRLVGRRSFLDYSHCELVLRALAAFHAGSIIIEENNQHKLNELYPDLLFENLFVDDNNFKTNLWFHSAVETVVSSVRLLRKYKRNTDISKINLEKLKKFLYQMYELIKPSKKYRNVVTHGDLWINNLLFKYDDDDDETPVDLRLVDYQLVRYTPPAVDIMSFLHLDTTQDFRRVNEKKLLSLYHTSLGEELARHGYQVEDFLPWSEFEETCEVYKALGCIIAPCYHHFSTFTEEVLKDHMAQDGFNEFFFGNRCELVEKCCDEDDFYRKRVITDLEELIEFVNIKLSKKVQGTCNSCYCKNEMKSPEEVQLGV